VNQYISHQNGIYHMLQLYKLLSKRCDIHCALSSTMFNPLHSKNCLKRTPAIKVATMKFTNNLHYERKPYSSHAYHKNQHFLMSAKTKEENGKSEKNTWYVLWYANRHLLSRRYMNNKTIKPAALAIIELASQSVSQ